MYVCMCVYIYIISLMMAYRKLKHAGDRLMYIIRPTKTNNCT